MVGNRNLVCGRMERLEREAEGQATLTAVLPSRRRHCGSRPSTLRLAVWFFPRKMPNAERKRGWHGISPPLPEMMNHKTQDAAVACVWMGALCLHPSDNTKSTEPAASVGRVGDGGGGVSHREEG